MVMLRFGATLNGRMVGCCKVGKSGSRARYVEEDIGFGFGSAECVPLVGSRNS